MSQQQEEKPDHKTCLEILNLVLDGEATPEQQEMFVKHVQTCLPYYEIYNLDMTIKGLLKTKCCSKDAPNDLLDAIKTRVNGTLEK